MDFHISNIFKELCNINTYDNILSGEIADDESNHSPKPINRKKKYRTHKKISKPIKNTIKKIPQHNFLHLYTNKYICSNYYTNTHLQNDLFLTH